MSVVALRITTDPPVRTVTAEGTSDGPASIVIVAVAGGVAARAVTGQTSPAASAVAASAARTTLRIRYPTQCPSVNANTATTINAGNSARYTACQAGRRIVHRASNSHNGNHSSVARPTDR